MPQFAIIEFSSGELSVVAEKWFTPEKQQVYWPPYKDSYSYRRSLQRQEEPNEHSWQLYPVARCFYETDDLDKALEKQKQAEVTSNLESDDDEPLVRTRNPPRRYSFNESDDENQSSNFKRPPKFLCDNEKSVKRKKQETTFQREHSVPQTEISSPWTANAQEENIENRSLSQPTPSVSEANTLAKNIVVNSGTASLDCEKGFDVILKQILYIKKQNCQILEILQNREVQHSHHESCSINNLAINNVNLPMTNEEELLELEKCLKKKEDFEYLIKNLSNLGGTQLSLRVNRILRRVMSDELAATYSYFGKRNEKKAFAHLKLKEVLICAVQKSGDKEADEKNIEDSIKVWLKHAPQRLLALKKK